MGHGPELVRVPVDLQPPILPPHLLAAAAARAADDMEDADEEDEGAAGGDDDSVTEADPQFVTWHTQLAHQEKEQRAWYRRQRADWERHGGTSYDIFKRRANCFLCNEGVATLDAGADGTALFSDLVEMAKGMMAQRHPAAVTRAMLRHHRERMVPFFRDYGIALAPMDELITYEHVATRLHTLNPTHMLTTQMREVNEEISFYQNHLKRRDDEDKPVNVECGKLLLANRKFLVGLYARPLSPHPLFFPSLLPHCTLSCETHRHGYIHSHAYSSHIPLDTTRIQRRCRFARRQMATLRRPTLPRLHPCVRFKRCANALHPRRMRDSRGHYDDSARPSLLPHLLRRYVVDMSNGRGAPTSISEIIGDAIAKALSHVAGDVYKEYLVPKLGDGVMFLICLGVIYFLWKWLASLQWVIIMVLLAAILFVLVNMPTSQRHAVATAPPPPPLQQQQPIIVWMMPPPGSAWPPPQYYHQQVYDNAAPPPPTIRALPARPYDPVRDANDSDNNDNNDPTPL